MPPKVIYISPHSREISGVWFDKPWTSYNGEPALKYVLETEQSAEDNQDYYNQDYAAE